MVVCVFLLALDVLYNFRITGYDPFAKSTPTIILQTNSRPNRFINHPHPPTSTSRLLMQKVSNLLKTFTIYGLDPLLLPRLCTICL